MKRSSQDLLFGMLLVVMSGFFVGVELLYRAAVGGPSEYFEWWIPVTATATGVFSLLRYRSKRVRRFSRAVGESPYYKALWLLIGLAIVVFGIYLAMLVGGDFDAEGALPVLGLAALFEVSGLVLTVRMVRDLRSV